MSLTHLSETAERYLRRLCLEIPNRRVGSAGNREATSFFAEVVASSGFAAECPQFDCIDWIENGSRLKVGDRSFRTLVSPYSLGCVVSAPLVVASTVEELANLDGSDKIILLRADIAGEQLMPKNFSFYNPDRHREIIHLLETQKPSAIVAATSRNPELAGGVYPFPLIEDGDFDVPSVYTTEQEGDRLARCSGEVAALDIDARRIPSTGCNVIARRGPVAGHRVVVCAHIDAKDNSPGAIDNATGVVVLLLLADLLKDYSGTLGVELVAFNGEDYYSAPGQVQYLKDNAGRLDTVVLAANPDGVGYKEGKTAHSLYECPVDVASSIRRAFSSQENTVEGQPWYQGDHSIFIQNQVPAMAITSDRFMELSTYVTHTPKDRPEIVDCEKLVRAASALRDLVSDIGRVAETGMTFGVR